MEDSYTDLIDSYERKTEIEAKVKKFRNSQFFGIYAAEKIK